MKANEAPEKIYITQNFERRWFTKEIDDVSVEYAHTDSFIEKACEFIKERIVFEDNTWYTKEEITLKDKVIEDFKNYMKGE